MPALPIPDGLVVVARFANAIEAHLARTKLESEGIQAFVGDEHMISIDPFYDMALGGVKLRVRAADEEKAAKILGIQSQGSVYVPPYGFASSVLLFLLFTYLFSLFISWFGH